MRKQDKVLAEKIREHIESNTPLRWFGSKKALYRYIIPFRLEHIKSVTIK